MSQTRYGSDVRVIRSVSHVSSIVDGVRTTEEASSRSGATASEGWLSSDGAKLCLTL